MSAMKRIVWFIALMILPASAAFAQATLAGVVKDASGAVLPGVSVEASSSALIEKSRTTVTGETPVVDVQSATRQEVLTTDVIRNLPVTRSYDSLLTTVPSVTGGSLDVTLTPTMRIFTSHGGRGNEGNMALDGLNVGAA